MNRDFSIRIPRETFLDREYRRAISFLRYVCVYTCVQMESFRDARFKKENFAIREKIKRDSFDKFIRR